MYNALIIDDEESSREHLHLLLSRFCPQIALRGSAASVSAGIELISAIAPDLVFLDIEMPHQNGFDLIKEYKNLPFRVIFTTAYSQYALKAIKCSALDYLLKPIDPEELIKAIAKFVAAQKVDIAQNIDTLLQNLKENNKLERIVIQNTDGLNVVELKRIISCIADTNYTVFNLVGGEKIIASKSLKEYEEMLSTENFFRIHKSSLINLNFISRYIKGEGGYVVMTDNTTYEVSRRKKQEFLEKVTMLNA